MIAHGLELLGQAEGVEGFLWKLSLLLCIAWGIHWLVHAAHPQWRVHLWRFSGIACLILAVLMISGMAPKMSVSVQVPPLEPSHKTTIPMASERVGEQDFENVSMARPDVGMQQVATAAEWRAPAQKQPFPWRPTLLGVWISGACLGALRLLLGFGQLRRILKHSQSVPDGVLQTADQIRQGIGLRRTVCLRTVTEVQSPVLIWFSKPILLLPEYLCKDQGRYQLSAVLGHEFSHVRSRDLFWNGFLRGLGAVLWFHPLAWRMQKAHMEACELVADSTSARLMDNPRHYQGVVADIALHAHPSAAHMGLAFVWKSNVRRRLERLPKTLLQLPLRRRWLALSGGMALVALFVVAGCALIPQRSFTGVVLLPDGSPAGQAEVYMATPRKMIYAEDGNVKMRGLHQARTDAEGRFEIPQVNGRFKLVVVHDGGSLVITRKQWESGRELMLQPWGRIEGRMLVGSNALARTTIGLSPVIYKSSQFEHVDVEWHYSGTTGQDGRFVFERVVPGVYRCARTFSDGKFSYFVMPATALNVQSGSMEEVVLKQEGRRIHGQVDWSAIDVPYRRSMVYVEEVMETSRYPELRMDPCEQPEAWARFWRSDAGLALASRQANHQMVPCDEQGHFTVDHVRPGQYRFSVYAYPPEGSDEDSFKQLGGVSLEHEIGAGNDAVDLGLIKVMLNRPERITVGDHMPNLRFRLAEDGSERMLNDYLGKPMLVGFEGARYAPNYLVERIGDGKEISALQLQSSRSRTDRSWLKETTASPVSCIYGTVENSLASDYMLGMEGVDYPEAYLLNDKGTVLEKSTDLEELLPYVTGKKEISDSKNDSSRRFFTDTEFCIVKEAGGAAGNTMMMQEGRGMTSVMVSNGVNGEQYLMKVRYTGSRGLHDLYEIEMRHPGGIKRMSVAYEGKPLELFDDGVRKMLLRPKMRPKG